MNVMVPAAAALGLLLLYDGLTRNRTLGSTSWMSKIDQLAMESGMRSMTGRRLLLLSSVSGLVTVVVVAGVTSSLVLAVTFAIVVGWMPFAVARSRLISRRRRFREAWPDAIATLIAGVRAGVSLPESCAALAERGPKDLQSGFRAFSSTYRASTSFVTALQRLQLEMADPIADRIVSALTIAQQVGGTDLVRVLRTLGDFVREDLRVRKEIEARWSWTVTAARVAAAAPFIVLLLMATRPEAAAAYNSSTGVLLICAGTAVTILGYRLMLKAAQLPEESRVRT